MLVNYHIFSEQLEHIDGSCTYCPSVITFYHVAANKQLSISEGLTQRHQNNHKVLFVAQAERLPSILFIALMITFISFQTMYSFMLWMVSASYS